MKTLLTLTLLFFTFNSAICQDTENSIENTNIYVVNTAKKTYSLGSANVLQKAFGKVKAIKETDEMLGGFEYSYKYKGLIVEFHEHEWDATTINGPQYTVLLNGIPYKVGEPISRLKSSFPMSYKHTKNDRGLRIGIAHKKQLTDAFIFISYNSKGYITEIWIGNNNS